MNEAFELALALLLTLPGIVACSWSWLTQSQGSSLALSTLVSLSVHCLVLSSYQAAVMQPSLSPSISYFIFFHVFWEIHPHLANVLT